MVAAALRASGYTDPEGTWVPYFGFLARPIPIDWLLSTDPFLKALYDRHRFQNAGVLMNEPDTVYGWHVDGKRGASVNMLIGGEGHCLFRESSNLITDIEELEYEPDTFYLFNPQVEHMVVNLVEPRFLFSLEFADGIVELPYAKLRSEYP